MRVSSMIAANALLSKNPWNRLKPSLTKSDFAKELLRSSSRHDLPENVREAIQAGDAWYDDAVLITSRWINEMLLQQLRMNENSNSNSAGDAIYTPLVLSDYDQLVWGFNCPFLWRIHMEEVKGLYNDCMLRSTHHAEVGVGTGLFLRELNVPDSLVDVTLIDSNYNSLEVCERSLVTHPHYEYSRVRFQTLHGDILQPPPYELRGRFDSVAANFLLHCLPGGSKTCWDAIENMATVLNPHGVFFGTTILGQALVEDAERAGPAAMETLQLYNDAGIFGNLHHNYRDLSRMLHDQFDDVELWRTGYCAAWKARQRKR